MIAGMMVLIITILMMTTTMVVAEARTARHGEMQNSKAAQRANFLDQRAETVTLDLNMESLLTGLVLHLDHRIL